MSGEELREELSQAVKRAVADGMDPDEIDAVLAEMHDRVDRLRALEGSA